MPQVSLSQDGMFAAHAQQGLNVGEEFLLFGSAACRSKCVLWIMSPAAGKIVAIVGVVTSGHGDFIAVIEFGMPRRVRVKAKANLTFVVR